jgi:hypothetical protein
MLISSIKTLGSRSTNEDSIKIKTDQAILEMTRAYQQNSATVLKDVLAAVVNVEPKKHENFIVK